MNRQVVFFFLLTITATRSLPSESSVPSVKRETRREPKSQLDFVYIPGGAFRLGCEPGDDLCGTDESRGHRDVVHGFWLGTTEVTVESFERCVAARKCSSDVTTVDWPTIDPRMGQKWSRYCNFGQKTKGLHPMNCVSWLQAKEFCEWIDGRLPSAVEWEYAAKGGGQRIYPWGNQTPDSRKANFCDSACRKAHPEDDALATEDDGWPETAPVASYPEGISPDGVYDLSGNVWEWTDTDYAPRFKEIRGGGWNYAPARAFRASARRSAESVAKAASIGFRCAR